MAPKKICTGEATADVRRELDDFMWMEVLCRLPSTKHVFQCMCVSKHWSSLISKRYFIRRFTDHHRDKYGTDYNAELLMFVRYHSMNYKEQIGCFLASSVDGEDTKQALFLPRCDTENPIYRVESSCNDLLVYSERRRSYTYYIVNPFTKEYVLLPYGSYHSRPDDFHGYPRVGFVCEPFYRHDAGKLDRVANYRYRVVLIYLYLYSTDYEIETYCSETNQWSLLRGLDHIRYGCRSNNVVEHGGKLYWYNNNREVVAYNPFGASDEPNFNFLGLPETQVPWSCFYVYQMAKSQGSVLLMRMINDKQDGYVSILKLHEEAEYDDREVFPFECTIVINRIISDTCPSFIRRVVDDGDTPLVLGVHPNNRNVMFLGHCNSPRVASYNLATKEWHVVGEIQQINDGIQNVYPIFGVSHHSHATVFSLVKCLVPVQVHFC